MGIVETRARTAPRSKYPNRRDGKQEPGFRLARRGDRVSDGNGGECTVLDVGPVRWRDQNGLERKTTRLLLRDQNGVVFPMRAWLLRHGSWRLI